MAYAAWLTPPCGLEPTQGEGQFATPSYISDGEIRKSAYASWFDKPYEDLVPTVGKGDIALPEDTCADAFVEAAAEQAMWEPPSPGSNHEPRSPWFLCWRDRRTEARDFLRYLVYPNSAVSFCEEALLDFHMTNFHRLRLLCAVDMRVYIRHVLVLGGVTMRDLKDGPEFPIRAFRMYYHRWSGTMVDVDEATGMLTRRMSLPFLFHSEDRLNRKGLGKGFLYRGDDSATTGSEE
ncbi:hypothetical protein PUNSTDRAFT_138229 [Punctularia strigosozonata HHB-11173 SS5]|uniref:Uncharacterized protein n=1 Tax=Punctularia strigosozonata (strain HHB-11173) TaxID=741275 RepID=R7S551_PUNST|nr:uncharacterized protein PUNSTDRAFT_138229 [Punctularia strigosozonata HHB-11173 SS5]EIN05049.1 hypothetical protein PUNSTDRAFT_138229 [Punctularia strigosozonata HHB-11173 SS5]